jgi:hypothetical protein
VAGTDAAAVRQALEDHYRRHPEARSTLSEVAMAMARMDGNPLSDRPELIEQAAREVVAVNPNADGDDVLVQAAEIARRRYSRRLVVPSG